VLAAGYWGVVIADFQQGVIVFVGILIVSIWGVSAAGWGPGIVARLTELGEAGKLNPFQFTGWFRIGFENLPAGMIGTFFGVIVAIHLSTVASHLNLGALYATRDLYQHYLFSSLSYVFATIAVALLYRRFTRKPDKGA
jgi:Na+/proline symporter